MNFLHVYILNKFEKSKLVRSQILNMLAMEKNAIAIFIKDKDTQDNFIHGLMEDYNFSYKIVNNFNELISEVKNIKEICLIHARDFYTIALLGFMRNKILRNNKIYLLYDIRGLSYEEAIYNNNTLISRIKAHIKEPIIGYAIKKSNALSTVTENLRNVVIERYKISDAMPILVIPTCITNDYTKNNNKKNSALNKQIKIAYTGGTLSKWQKIDDVIDAMIKIKKGNPLTEFFFCVDDVELVKRKLKGSELDAIVGNCTNEEVINLLHTTDYGIILRDDNLLNKVAAPTKLTEYLVTNNRVIYSGSIGTIDDLSKFDTDDIFVNLNDITKNRKTLRKSDIHIPTEMLSHFLWEKNVPKYNSLMQMLIKDEY